MRARNEEKASGVWQSGLSQKVSFFIHHPQYLPSPPLKAQQLLLKPIETPYKLPFSCPFPPLMSLTSLTLKILLNNPHPFQSHLRTLLHPPSPKHASTKPLAQRASEYTFLSF